MDTDDRAYAYLEIMPLALPLEDVTARIGITPTEAWRQGDPGTYTKSRRDNGWCLHSPLPRTDGVSTHVEALVELLHGKQETLRESAESYELYVVGVAQYSPEHLTGLYVSKNVLQMIVEMGASKDQDLYSANSLDQDI